MKAITVGISDFRKLRTQDLYQETKDQALESALNQIQEKKIQNRYNKTRSCV